MISSPGALGEIFTGDAVSVALTANVDDVAWSIADSDNANWLDVDANTGILSEGVSGLRERLGISRVDPAAAGPAMISINEAARRLSIASSSVRILIREGALSGTQAMPSAPWRIPAVELFSADCPQSLRELVTEARSEGFVATGIKWMDSDGDLHAVGAADHLAVGSEAGSGLGRRPYRPPGGREALAHEQEMLVGLFGSLPLASMHRVSSHEADIILGLPYEGGGEAISPYDVEHAVEMLAQVRVVWRTWKEDVDRTRAGARREGAATTPDEELVLAIMQDDLLGLERALQRGAKVDAPIISKRFAPIARYTPSLLALGYPAMLEALLQHGANPNVEFPWGSSLLGLAIARERTDALDLLLRHGVDPRADARPYDLLRAALRANNLSILKVLLDAGAPLDPSPPNPGVPHVREQLARWTRRSGDEALALRIENMPLG